MIRRLLLAATILGVSTAARSDDAVQKALEARSAGAYAEAIQLLREAEAAHPDTRTELLLAETLAWNKQFEQAAELYEEITTRLPESRDALLGLARVRLWQGRYPAARQLYVSVLGRNASDREALEGSATAAYWAGDFRTAAREFRRADTPSARRSLTEIAAASRPGLQFDVEDTRDDQPFHAVRSAIRGSWFSDPLTRWDASIGTYHLGSDVAGARRAPFAVAGNQTVIPAVRLTVTASIGGIRTPDHRTHAIGGAAARLQLRPHSVLIVSFDRREVMTNATRLYPFVGTTSIRWQLDGDRYASLGAARLRYSDRNSGIATDGYVLVPIFKRSNWTVSAGASGLYRDTEEQRFYIDRISSAIDPATGQFRYTYRGAYNPYWAPDDLMEGRVLLGVETHIGKSAIKLQGDIGRARDRAVSFWPDFGATPFPPITGSARFDRSFSPRRVRVSAALPLGGDLSFNFGFEHSITAFYEANAFHATVGRRR